MELAQTTAHHKVEISYVQVAQPRFEPGPISLIEPIFISTSPRLAL